MVQTCFVFLFPLGRVASRHAERCMFQTRGQQHKGSGARVCGRLFESRTTAPQMPFAQIIQLEKKLAVSGSVVCGF